MRRILSMAGALPLLAGSAFGWGCEGHQMIALIARAHLTAAAAAAADPLLRENPIDPALERYCRERPADPMADSATWADDIRSSAKNGPWHYIDIPLAVSSGDAMAWCPPVGPAVDGNDRSGCVLDAITYNESILRDKSQPAAVRAEALRYVIHFYGDLSQPLHTEDNHDQGGNCTSIQVSFLQKPSNLHSIWDHALIVEELGKKHRTVGQLASDIDREFGSQWNAWGQAGIDPQAWAWEGHALAKSVAYANFAPTLPIAPRDAGGADKEACDAERAQVEAMHIAIGRSYIDAAIPVIREQIARGGYRLAESLNQIFR